MSIDEVYSAVGRDNVKLVDKQLEDTLSPTLDVYLGREKGPKPSLEAELKGDSVYRIGVFDSSFKTDTGIGVGSNAGELKCSYQIDWIDEAEGSFIARVDKIGMSFALDYVSPVNWPRDWRKKPKLVPDTVKIISILVVP